MKTLLAACCLLLAATAQAETWKFAVIGDVPYSDYERRKMPSLLRLIEDEQPEFIVHAGDIKRSSAKCSDEILLDRKALFDSSRVPFLYTPGDNEWTDCKVLVAGDYDPVERLNRLREIFFAEPQSLGQRKIAVERQSADFPENLRWRLGPVRFLTINVPGPNNNHGIRKQPSPEFAARNPAILDWLRQGFALARQEHARGIVVVMQADPVFKLFAAGLAKNGFRELLETLRQETLDFPGQVLLVHGDTHWHRIDHPLRRPDGQGPVANFTRLETFGYPWMGWIKVVIDTDEPALFRFESHAYP